MDFLPEPGFEPTTLGYLGSGFKPNALSIRPTTALWLWLWSSPRKLFWGGHLPTDPRSPQIHQGSPSPLIHHGCPRPRIYYGHLENSLPRSLRLYVLSLSLVFQFPLGPSLCRGSQLRPGGRLSRLLRPGGRLSHLLRPGGCLSRQLRPGGRLSRLLRPGGRLSRLLRPGGRLSRLLRPGGRLTCQSHLTSPLTCQSHLTSPLTCQSHLTSPLTCQSLFLFLFYCFKQTVVHI